MYEGLKDIEGFEISFHEKSKRIVNIQIEDQVIERLIFPFKKFDVTALEYKPFTRFTISKSLNDIASGKLGNFINSILNEKANKFTNFVSRSTYTDCTKLRSCF